MSPSLDDTFRALAHHGPYATDAYRFLFEALDHAFVLAGKVEAEGKPRHISGQELLEGLRQHALRIFGPLALQTWRSWGVTSSLDWGRIVFLLVDAQVLNRQESDRLEDFDDAFDYERFFVTDYRPDVSGVFG